MNKRIRKKWLKKHHLWVDPEETWSLDTNIAAYIVPRLKLFKKLNNGYPGTSDMNTPEKWDDTIDKMITAFEYINSSFDWNENESFEEYHDRQLEKNKIIEEGLRLFSKWYRYLWW